MFALVRALRALVPLQGAAARCWLRVLLSERRARFGVGMLMQLERGSKRFELEGAVARCCLKALLATQGVCLELASGAAVRNGLALEGEGAAVRVACAAVRVACALWRWFAKWRVHFLRVPLHA